LTMLEARKILEHLTHDHAARVCFSIATSANWGETVRAQRVDLESYPVLVRGTKRTSRRRLVPIVREWQRLLLAYCAENARGADGKLFRFNGGFHQALRRAC